MKITILPLILHLVLLRYSVGENPLVELPTGLIQGRESTTYEGKSFRIFEKIPYAAPPLDNLRFKEPQPPKKWYGILNTTYLDVACYQLGTHAVPLETEDCLYLNVYTPTEGDLLPVMVYIHGGGFTTGWSLNYQPDLFVNNGVILVTINYRLGIFGFLSTEDEVVPGNNGLKDHLQALEWVHHNINLFGGDPTKVTIFGQSTGAASCGFHLLNQNSAGLFSRVILESGTFLTQVALQRNARAAALTVATTFDPNFDTNSTSETLVDFLQNLDAALLNAATEEYTTSMRNTWDSIAVQDAVWAPVIEVESNKAFLTKKMYGLLKSGDILKVPTMMGFTSEECISRISDLGSLRDILEDIDEHVEYLVPSNMQIIDEQSRTEMGVQIKKIYTGGEPLADNLASGVRYCSDNRITRPMLKHAELFSKIAPTYFYQFSYAGVIGGSDLHYEGLGSAGHTAELNYLFCSGSDCNDSTTYPEEDLVTRQRLIKLWTNFAKYANPTPEIYELFQNVTWPQFSGFLYFDIDKDLEGSSTIETIDPVIHLPNGAIQGRVDVTTKNTTFYAFEGIPYAAPPVGYLRFKAPQPPENWSGTLDTRNLQVTCFQTSSNTNLESEDCLYINVFAPEVRNGTTLPVMFFIYGGGFVDGASQYYYPDLFVNEGVILVTFNYRVGPFGFLSTQDDIIPGNNGLKDQKLALEWTYKNIYLFGGDPQQITIFGQSAGAASCAYQLLNQDNEGLFQGAILQSGTFLSPCSYQRKARNIAFATAAFLNSTFKSSNDSQSLLDFLQSVDARDVDAAAEKYHNYEYGPEDIELYQGYYWAPVIEVENPDAFLTKKMYGLLEAGDIIKVPVLMGITSEENLSLYSSPDMLRWVLESFDQNLAWVVPNDMQIVNETSRTEMGRSIREIYTGGEPFAEHLGDGVRYSSDTSLTRSCIKFAEMYSKLSRTYFYQFSYDGDMGQSSVHYDGAENVAHAEDLAYLFCTGSSCDGTDYPESDQLTRQRLVHLWINFAKYQNPTPEPSDLVQNITWPSFETESDSPYLDISENLEIRNHPKQVPYEAWTRLYDSLGFKDFDTY